MKEHLDKIVPIIIAIILVFINARKKSKKPMPISKPSQVETPIVAEKTEDSDILNPFFKSFDNLLNFSQPLQLEEVKSPIQKISKKQPIKVPDISTDTTSIQIKPVLQEQIIKEEHFDFNLRRAIIDAEIINRKYFSI